MRNPTFLTCYCFVLALLASGSALAGATGEICQDTTKRTVIFSADFEPGSASVDETQFTVTGKDAHGGKQSASAAVEGAGKYKLFDVPFNVDSWRTLELSFWIRSDDGMGCAVYVGKDLPSMSPLLSRGPLTKDWVQIKKRYKAQMPPPMSFQIVAPTPTEKPTGSVMIDDVELVDLEFAPFTRLDVEDYPAMAADQAGDIWLAVLGEPLPKREVRVYKAGDAGGPVCAWAPQDNAALVYPTVLGLEDGCFVASAVESGDKWSLVFAFIDGQTRRIVHTGQVKTEGAANTLPVAAHADGRVCLVWEANPRGQRGIYAAWVTPDAVTTPERISLPDAVSSNPAVVALPNGDVFAAWDSVRGDNQDIYGAWCRDGKWEAEQRLTQDVRMERHASLAAHDGQVWMTWEAASFPDHRVQSLEERRVVVAALTNEGLKAALNLFDSVSEDGSLLMRPRISFDPLGRLWLTARKSLGQQYGWQPLAWCYGGERWTGPHALWEDEGRWRAIDMAWGRLGGLAAVQRDSAASTLHAVRKSEVMLVELKPEWAAPDKPLKLAALEMPETEFRLAKRIEHSAANLPRQTMDHNGQQVTLYWGDLHEHTDISSCGRAVNPPAHDLYTTQRDVEGLDFTAVTDHCYNLDKYDWAYLQAETTANNDPGRFVTFLAQEWTSDHIQYDPPRTYKRYGHHNLIFLDTHFDRSIDSRKPDQQAITPQMVWDDLKGVDFITIPHQIADHGSNCPTDWTFTDDRLQPLAEIYQQRESYEYQGCPRQAKKTAAGHFLQDAWAQGIIIGVIASADHGGGHGKAGIWAKDLTRESLFEAFRARHTFGMSDPKMSLFVSAGAAPGGDAMMGDVVTRKTNGPIPLHIKALAPRPIKELVIWRNNQMAHRSEPNTTEIDMDWVDNEPLNVDHAWYYVRLHCTDDELAWSSPIWFRK